MPRAETCGTALLFPDQRGQRDDLGRGLQQVAEAQRPRGGLLPLPEGAWISPEPPGFPPENAPPCVGSTAASRLSKNDFPGFLSLQLRGNHPCVLLAEQGRGKNFVVYKPNIGKQSHPESLDNLQQRYRKASCGCHEATPAEN